MKDPAPKIDTSDVSKAQPAAAGPAAKAPKKGLLDKAKEKLGLGAEDPEADEDDVDVTPAEGGVTVTLDKVTLIPGAVASGVPLDAAKFKSAD